MGVNASQEKFSLTGAAQELLAENVNRHYVRVDNNDDTNTVYLKIGSPIVPHRVVVSVSAVIDATTYTITINGTPCAYLSDGSATEAEIVDGLVDEINGSAEAGAVLATNVDDTVQIDSKFAPTNMVVTVGANLAKDSDVENDDPYILVGPEQHWEPTLNVPTNAFHGTCVAGPISISVVEG